MSADMRYDIIIVGTGAGGGTIAHQLAHSGKRILIKNINGSIHVEHSSNGRVEVSAEKTWRRGNPDDVRIEQKKVDGEDVLICALWTEDSRCDENGIHNERRRSGWNDRNDVSVRFVMRVPDGVRVDVATVNGGLEVSGVTTDVRATTVNGSIDAKSAGGPVRANTVNGSIRVSMANVGNADNLEYETIYPGNKRYAFRCRQRRLTGCPYGPGWLV